MLSELVLRTRCYRRFKQTDVISKETLTELVNIARVSASATNSQPLKYIISSDLRTNAMIFEQLGWAGYLHEWKGPAEGERPAAYIIILDDTRIRPDARYDAGIALQNIRLAAMEKGIGSCVIGSVNREVLREELDVPLELEIMLVLAMGIPAEEIVLEETGEEHGIRYWRDENGCHHVPKRELQEVLFKAY